MPEAPRLYEREREIRDLERALEDAGEGQGRIVLIEGEPGIGKTRLLAETAKRARRAGLSVLKARGIELERGFAFGVVRQLLERTVRSLAPTERRLVFSGAAALAQVVLDLEADEEHLDVGFASLHGLYWLVANLSERTPLLLGVDDAHWADAASIRFLSFLAPRIEELPVAMVMTARGGEDPVLESIAADPVCERLRPDRLSPAAIARLVANGLDSEPDADFIDASIEVTAGNPFYVHGLIAELSDHGIDPVASQAPLVRTLGPRAIGQSVLFRIAHLSSAAAGIARAVAVLGDAASTSNAAKLVGVTVPDGDRAADELVRAGVFAPGERLAYAHPIVRNAVYQDIGARRRSELHRRAAELLQGESAPVERVAAHLLATDSAGRPEAVEALRAAAREAIGRGAPESAVAYLRRARDEPPPESTLPSVLFELGVGELLASDPAALDDLRRAAELSHSPTERAEVALALGRALLFAGEPEEAMARVESAIHDLEDLSSDLALALRSWQITVARSHPATRELADQSLNSVRGMGTAATAGGRLVLGHLAYEANMLGEDAGRAVEIAREALAQGALARDRRASSDAYIVPISMLVIADSLEEAHALYGDSLELARGRGAVWDSAAILAFRAWAAYLLGRLADAEADARGAIRRTADSAALAPVRGYAAAHLANVLVDRGELADAEGVIGAGRDELEETPVTWANDLLFALGRVHAAATKAGEAADCFLACGRRLLELGIPNPAWLPWRSQAAIALQGVGEAHEAEELAAEELRLARRFGARRPIGIALQARGLVEGGERGLELLREAVDVLERSEARLEHARAVVDLGAALRRANRRREARQPLRAGLELARACGAIPLAERARDELAAAGARPRRLVLSGLESLTASERRVADMAASGMSNPEIAQALFVTRKTVELHLTHAYAKLEIGGREELAEALEGGVAAPAP